MSRAHTVYGQGAFFPEYFSNTAVVSRTIRIDTKLRARKVVRACKQNIRVVVSLVIDNPRWGFGGEKHDTPAVIRRRCDPLIIWGRAQGPRAASGSAPVRRPPRGIASRMCGEDRAARVRVCQ